MAIQVMRVEEKWILKDYRDKHGMTQQQVADKARIQLRQYQRYESGEVRHSDKRKQLHGI